MGVHGDDKRLRQVLINLLGNAVKFTEQGTVTLRVQCLPSPPTPAGEREQHRLRIEVEDTGIGMSPDFLHRLFLPFEQSRETARKTEGTGLGLAITHKIVQLMGSDLQVRSELGQGSCFTFEIGLTAAREWAQAAAMNHHRQILRLAGPARCLLVVDDKWENRSVIVNLLQPLGFEVLEAEHGAAALEQLQQCQPDLIVTDLMMPVLDGFALMAQLQASEQWSSIPVIASSASVFESDQHRSFDVGAVDFLPKPIQAQQLLDFLEHHLALTWVYADGAGPAVTDAGVPHPEPWDAAPLKIPTGDRLTALYDLAKRGRIRALEERLSDLAAEDKAWLPFVQTLRPLTQQFQVKELQRVLETYLDPLPAPPLPTVD